MRDGQILHDIRPRAPKDPLCENCLRLFGILARTAAVILERDSIARESCHGPPCPGVWNLPRFRLNGDAPS